MAHTITHAMPIPAPQPYTHVRLIADDGIKHRFEIRVSTFIEFDDNLGRRAVAQKLSRDEALKQAKEIARSERARTGAPEWK
jgi:hypothetical protein